MTMKKERARLFDLPGEGKDSIKIDRYDISINLIQPNLETLVNNVDNNEIIIPPFQRKFRWSVSKASRLIESFLIGLPVPPIFVYEDPEQENKLIVIDGQQRLLSIYFYFKNAYPREGLHLYKYDNLSGILNTGTGYDPFQLIEIDDRWSGKSFEELKEDDRNWLKRRPLWIISVRQLRPEEEKISSMFYIFERLNTGGEILTPMEIRKALYYGEFYKLCEKLNQYEKWRKIIVRRKESDKLEDVEWILRIFALENWSNYEEPMKEFLNNYIRYNRHLGTPSLSVKEQAFKKTCDLIYATKIQKPFHIPKGRLNIAVLDSMMVLAMKYHSVLTGNHIQEIFGKMTNSEEYSTTIVSRVNIKEKILKNRFRILENIFKSVIGG